MSFALKRPEIDLGQTPIENIFIHDFMPMANGTYVKVYLLGYHFASQNSAQFDNESLARHLRIALTDVVEAWRFWQSKGIVEIVPAEEDVPSHLFDVQFLSIRETYITNNYQVKSCEAQPPQEKPSDLLMAGITNPNTKKMIGDIQHIIRRALTPQEAIKILDWLREYALDTDLMTRAFVITFEEKKIKKFHFNYVQSILAKWYDANIATAGDLDDYLAQANPNYALYRKVNLALGNQAGIFTEGLRDMVDHWRESEGYSEDYILYIVKQATLSANSPNLKYVNSLFESVKATGMTTIEGAKQHFENSKSKTDNKTKSSSGRNDKRSKFQNFSQRTIANMSNDQLTDILKRKSTTRKSGE